jgi:hypothetical protein
LINPLDGRREGDVCLYIAIRWPSPPRKIATDPDTERPAQELNAVLVTMLLDKLVNQFSLAKKASAFLRISRS